jgi:SAM-dependent methyltransferase
VAIGLFVGSQPIFGCHTPIVLALCLWLRLDAAIAWVASNISNPFFAPFLLTAEVQVGAYVLHGEPVVFTAEMARETGFSGFAGYAFLGAPFVGLALAATGALLVFGFVAARRRLAPARVGKRKPYRLPEDAPEWWHAAERVAWRYAPSYETEPAERARFHYVRVKLVGDPVSKLVANVEGEDPGVLGEVFDLGTGRGQLPILLLELGRASSARGVDWDEGKIAEANRAARQAGEREALPAAFEVGDATDAAVEPADTVLLIDLLHYLTLAEQDDVLTRAAAAVRPGGRVVVREADTERGWRSFMTWAEELVFTAVRFNRGARVRFRPAREIVAALQSAGLACDVLPAWGKTPFSNVLVVGRRPVEDHADLDAADTCE